MQKVLDFTQDRRNLSLFKVCQGKGENTERESRGNRKRVVMVELARNGIKAE